MYKRTKIEVNYLNYYNVQKNSTIKRYNKIKFKRINNIKYIVEFNCETTEFRQKFHNFARPKKRLNSKPFKVLLKGNIIMN